MLEPILKKLKIGKDSGEENIPSELYKYRSDKFRKLLKLLNEIYIPGTTPAEWKGASVMPIIKKKIRKIQKNTDR